MKCCLKCTLIEIFVPLSVLKWRGLPAEITRLARVSVIGSGNLCGLCDWRKGLCGASTHHGHCLYTHINSFSELIFLYFRLKDGFQQHFFSITRRTDHSSVGWCILQRLNIVFSALNSHKSISRQSHSAARAGSQLPTESVKTYDNKF